MPDSSAQPYLLKFWYRPGTVVGALLKEPSGHSLAVACGLLFGVAPAYRLYLSQESVSALIVVFGAFVGFFGLYLFSWLLRNFGRWFGAQAKLFELRIALGWGLMPWTILSLSMAVAIACGASAEALAAFAWPLFGGFIYGYVTILLSIAAALRLSVLKAFMCLVVTCIVSIFPLTLLAQFIAQAFGVAPVGS
ncbi:MAG TPA: hypothetical protein DCX06_01110 [Opitutae bacterium]|nr:hypothetical protein [Opitutae bacterium]